MRLVLVLVAGAMFATSCSDNGAGGSGPYTREEVRWLKRLASWETDYSTAEARVDPAYEEVIAGTTKLGALRRVLRPLEGCAASIQRKVREPPTDRLGKAFDLLVDACEQDARYARALERSFSDTAEQSYIRDDAARRSRDLVIRAQRFLEQRLLANRRLPVAGGVVTMSRIEPRLTRAAQSLSLGRVEVRCWGASEWPRVTREYNAYSGGNTHIAGFASGLARANIAPDYCRTLVRLVYQHWRPSEPLGLEDAADAVALLAHETEHLVDPDGTEAETECRAVQDIRLLARALGTSRIYAARLANAYWTAVYPTEFGEYRTRRCHNGSLLDINPETDVWP